MTQPQPPSQPVTKAQVAAAVLAAQAFRGDNDPNVKTLRTIAVASTMLANARDRAYTYAYTLILRTWRNVDVYDGRSVQAFTQTAAGYMKTAQSAVAQQSAAAQKQILTSMDITVPKGVVPSDPVDVRGTPTVHDDGTIDLTLGTSHVNYDVGGHQVVDLDEDATTVGMFNRPARTQRYLESKGVGSAEARAAAELRMQTLVGDNLMLAQRLAEAEILAHAASVDSRVIGLRRVIHPELSRTGVCGLCVAASDRLYRVRELRPIHSGCNCTTAAVTEDFDPADELNAVDLKALYGDAGGTSGAHLKRTKYSTDEHGELGPVLVPKKDYKPRKAQPAPARGNDAPRVNRKARPRSGQGVKAAAK
jgi:hypothetical protein